MNKQEQISQLEIKEKKNQLKQLKTLTKEEKLSYCSGCEDNFYNGNNNLNVKECWLLKTMKIIKRKKIHINQVPPWNQEAEDYSSCYKQKGYVFVEEKRTC